MGTLILRCVVSVAFSRKCIERITAKNRVKILAMFHTFPELPKGDYMESSFLILAT